MFGSHMTFSASREWCYNWHARYVRNCMCQSMCPVSSHRVVGASAGAAAVPCKLASSEGLTF